jgi:tRNA(Ile)-lysidine synthetase-like protein
MDIAKTISLTPGRYVVAVSGGVDSMVLLDILRSRPDLKLTVAHYDHGIREDSRQDRLLVQDVVRRHKLPFVYDEGRLGAGTSEDKARKARYAFLRGVRKQTGADAIVTAHHQDDALETAIHNVLRGTGRKGLSPLHARTDIRRPMLGLPKEQLLAYAQDQGLEWHEDSTNQDLAYRRNYIRHVLLSRLKAESPEAVDRLRQLVRRQAELNRAIDEQLTHMLHTQPKANALQRHDLLMLPHAVSQELIAHWLRVNHIRGFDKKFIDKIVVKLKTARPGKRLDIDGTHAFVIGEKSVYLQSL